MVSDSSVGARRSYDILLIEPNPDSVSPFIESFETTEVTNEVTIVSSGDEAFDFIDQRDEYEGAPRPDLVLLDLDLPDTSGLEILAEIKDHAELQKIPVIILTMSDAAEDVARTYELHANAYVRKPDSSEKFDHLAQSIEDFWLGHVILPPKET